MVYFPGRGCWFLKMPSQSAGTELSGFEDSDTFYLVLMETNLPTPIWQGPTVNLPEGTVVTSESCGPLQSFFSGHFRTVFLRIPLFLLNNNPPKNYHLYD